MEMDELNAKESATSSNGSVRNRGSSSRNQGSHQSSDYNMLVNEFEASVLASLDQSSYELALGNDTKLVLENYLFPMSFPWYKPKAPLIRTIPRDIDDMPGLWFAGDVRMHHGSERGLLGFGAFDQGLHGYHQLRNGGRETCALDGPEVFVGDSPHENDPYLPVQSIRLSASGCEYNKDAAITASARRSTDPGIMEMSAMLPPPRSLESALLKYQTYGVLSNDPWLRHDARDIDQAKRIIEADRKVVASSMPLHMSALRGGEIAQQQSFFGNQNIDHDQTVDGLTTSNLDTAFFKEYKRVGQEAKISRERSEQSMKKWSISVKVENVSSRASLFSSSRQLMGNVDGKMLLASPLLCAASLPAAVIQSGKHVLPAESKVDTSDMPTSSRTKKKDGDNRMKNSSQRRTHLVWSSSTISGSSKLPFSDFLTGQKIDAKCPKDVLIAVRLNGKLLSKPTTTSAKAGSSVDAPAKMRIQKPSVHYSPAKALDVEASIRETCDSFISQNIIEPPSKQINRYHRVNQILSKREALKRDKAWEYDNGNKLCDHEYLSLSHDKRQKLKGVSVHNNKATIQLAQDFIPMKHGGSHILKQVEPQIRLITLSDCSSKILCETPGRMQGSSVHTLLSMAARGLGNVCSICWSGNDASEVFECVECGLLAHLECCLDIGTLTTCADSNDKKTWRCAVCLDSLNTYERKETDDTRSSQQPAYRKSSRLSKVPSRFVQNPSDGSDTLPDNQLYHKRLSKVRSSYKCALCPHSGGAMSRLGTSDGADSNDENQRWTHDICRIWGEPKQARALASSDDTNSTPAGTVRPSTEIFQSYISDICALCGMGAIHNLGREKEEIIDHCPRSYRQDRGVSSVVSSDLVPGLVRCAARGCFVTFHPMCAVLSSKLRQDNSHIENVKSSRKEKDHDLSKIYTLTLVNVQRQNERTNISSGTVVPLAFCGLHNPLRDEELYGKICIRY